MPRRRSSAAAGSTPAEKDVSRQRAATESVRVTAWQTTVIAALGEDMRRLIRHLWDAQEDTIAAIYGIAKRCGATSLGLAGIVLYYDQLTAERVPFAGPYAGRTGDFRAEIATMEVPR